MTLEQKRALALARARVRAETLIPSGREPAYTQEDWDKLTYAPTVGMGTGERLAAGAGAGLSSLAQGIGQRLGLVSQKSVDETAALDKPLQDTTAGAAGRVAGVAVPLAATSIIPGANTVAGGAAVGALSGLAEPTQTGESVMGNVAKNTILGGAGNALARAIPTTTKALIDPLRQGGRELITGRTLNAAAGSNAPNIMAAARNPQQFVPGSSPNLAEATQDAGIAGFQLAASSASPEVKRQLAEQARTNMAARLRAVEGIAGDEAAMQGAQQARKQATAPLLQQISESTAEVNPSRVASLIDRIIERSPGRGKLTDTLEKVKSTLYEPYPLQQRGQEAWQALDEMLRSGPRLGKQDTATLTELRTVMDRVKRGAVDADEALEQMKGMKGINSVAAGAIDDAKRYLKMPDEKLRTNASELYQGARKNITDVLEAREGGARVNDSISRELSVILRALDHQINKSEPAFGQYLQAYTSGSRPINQMEVGRFLQNKMSPALMDYTPTGVGPTREHAEAYARALRDAGSTVKSATGYGRAPSLESVMEPGQIGTMNAVAQDLARAGTAQDLAKTTGSTTAQNLAGQNLIRQFLGPLGMPQSFSERVAGSSLAQPLTRATNLVYSGAEQRIQQEIARALRDPAYAARLMEMARTPGVKNPELAKVLMGVQQAAAMTPLAIGMQ